jgi:hypothetical protein
MRVTAIGLIVSAALIATPSRVGAVDLLIRGSVAYPGTHTGGTFTTCDNSKLVVLRTDTFGSIDQTCKEMSAKAPLGLNGQAVDVKALHLKSLHVQIKAHPQA